MKFYLLYILFLLSGVTFSQQLLISKLCNSNHTFPDQEGNFHDWFEIYNRSSASISTTNLFVSDKAYNLDKWALPDSVIHPGEHWVIFASGLDTITGSEIHANFKINSKGEELYLSNGVNLLDSLPAVCIPTNWSLVKDTFSMELGWDSLSIPYFYQFIPIPQDQISWSHNAGKVNPDDLLDISSDLNLTVKYNLNGVPPGALDPDFQVQSFSEFTSDHQLSYISTAPSWQIPDAVPYFPSVTAQSFKYGCPVSPSETRSFLIQENTAHHLFSLSLDRNELFHFNTGIFVEGAKNNFYQKGENWERTGFLEYFHHGEVVHQQQVDFRLNGLGSRNSPQKSLRFYIKEKYGNYYWQNPFSYRSDTVLMKRFILRSPASDFTSSLIRDVLFTRFLRNSTLDYLEYEPSYLYINGEFWGLYFLKERPDKHFFSQKIASSEMHISIIENNSSITEGNGIKWTQLKSYLQNHDLSDSTNYNYLCTQLDVANFAEFLIQQGFAANWDLTQRNVKIWYDDSLDTKIRFLAFDCDACFYKTDLKFFEYLSKESDPENILGLCYRKLIVNHQFKQLLYQTALKILSDDLNPQKTSLQLDSLITEVKPFIIDQNQRWHHPESPLLWHKKVDEIHEFLHLRKFFLLDELSDIISEGLCVYPNPANSKIRIEIPEKSAYRIFSTDGKLLANGTYMGNIDIGNLPNGMYLIHYQFGDFSGSSRFTVVR